MRKSKTKEKIEKYVHLLNVIQIEAAKEGITMFGMFYARSGAITTTKRMDNASCFMSQQLNGVDMDIITQTINSRFTEQVQNIKKERWEWDEIYFDTRIH